MTDYAPHATTHVAPTRGHLSLLQQCLELVVRSGGSDLHLRPAEPPFIRQGGRLVPLPGMMALGPEDLQQIVEQLTAHVPARRAEFEAKGEADLSYGLDGVARFRVNIFRERGNVALTLRVIPQEVPRLDQIGVPPVLAHLALQSHGLILVTGATGSGKTTTLAAMIDHINRNSQKHILTIEDPIEIVHPNHQSLVSQREVGSDTGDFMQGLRRALRQDPDVILIGEIRDEETMRTALAAAETGHLVLATLHTINASETIARVLDLFPSESEKQARSMLAGALKGIVSQRLARTPDGGRVPVVEVLINTSRIADCIANPEETARLGEAISGGEYYGMQTFDQALIRLIVEGRITQDEAAHHVSSPQNFKLQLESTLAQLRHEAQQVAAPAASAGPTPQAPPPHAVMPAPVPHQPLPTTSMPGATGPAPGSGSLSPPAPLPLPPALAPGEAAAQLYPHGQHPAAPPAA